MKPLQTTIGAPCEVDGYGLHSGEATSLSFHPAPEDSGIRFRRTDLENRPEIAGTADVMRSAGWETTLGVGEANVRTVEHVLAAVHGLGIDNIRVDLDSPEPPALDGSAAGWCDLLHGAGVERQDAAAPVLKLDRPLSVRSDDSSYTVLPNVGFRVTATIEFENPTIGRQFISVDVDPETFETELASARTFGLAAWGPSLRAQGLAKGASLANTIVVGDNGLEDGCDLRYPDEFVRHKALDIVGDLALVGARLNCHVVADRPGHRGNIVVAKKLREELTGEGPPLDIHAIMQSMPHRYPMLLVDRVLELEERTRIVGLKNVTINEPFFAGHFPGHPIMPGVLIVEALAQCGGLLLMTEYEKPEDKLVYFMSMDDVKFRRPVTPGDQLVFEVEMLQLRSRTCRMQGIARVDGRVVAEAKIMASVVDK